MLQNYPKGAGVFMRFVMFIRVFPDRGHNPEANMA